LGSEQVARLPSILSGPLAVLWDTEQLRAVYVVDAPDGGVIAIDVYVPSRERPGVLNEVGEAVSTTRAALRDRRFKVLDGEP
jgi:hypothetical protein